MKISFKPDKVFRFFFMAGALLTALVAVWLLRVDEARVRRDFEREINNIRISLQAVAAEDVAILRSVSGLFESSEHVSRAEFQLFCSGLLARYPSVFAISWLPRVHGERREDLEAVARAEGLADFQLKTIGGGTAPRKAEYYPLLYVEPMEFNEAMLGFDISENTNRFAILTEAIDSAEVRATSRFRVRRLSDDSPALLFYLPVYEGRPTTVENRRAQIRGFIGGHIHLRDMLEAAGALHTETRGIQLVLRDAEGRGKRSKMLDTGIPPAECARKFEYQTSVDLADGRNWTLTGVPTVEYVGDRRSPAPLASALVGLLLSTFLASYMARVLREKRRVEELVSERTRDLKERTEALAASNERLLRAGQQRERLQRQYADLTDHEQRRLGQELHDSLGQQIAVAAMMANQLKGRDRNNAGGDRERIELLERSILSARSQVRALSKGLLPVEIKAGGLRDALSELARSVKGVGAFEVEFRDEGDLFFVDNAISTQLYRIAQEALRNALEHGEVSRVLIRLAQNERLLELEVSDDGRGWDANDSEGFGSGLSIMRYRAELIQAELEIVSAPGSGTRVICRLQRQSKDGA